MEQLIKTTSLGRAHVMSYCELMNNVAIRLKKCDLEKLQLKNEANRFHEVFIDFQKSVKQTRKTGFTEHLKAVECNCDKIILALQHFVKGFMLLPDEEKVEMARKVRICMRKRAQYIAPLAQREKLGVINVLVRDLKEPPMAQIIEQLGLVSIVEQLAENIQLFDKLYHARSEKEATFVVGLTARKRQQMQQAFEHLCATIEALAILGDRNDYQPLASYINVEVSKVKRLYLFRKSR